MRSRAALLTGANLARALNQRRHHDAQLPNMSRQGDLHVAGTMKTAWFKDPDGNIFSLVTPPNTAARQTVGASSRSTA